MIRKGTYKIPVSGSVDLGSIRSNSCTLYEASGNGQYSPVSGVKLSDIPGSKSYDDVATVEVMIEDNPFNRGVAKCCSRVGDLCSEVDSLTTSVNLGATGIAGAKAAAAHKIGKSLSRGFAKYIGYMIREKMTLLKAKLPGLALTIDAAGKQLAERKSGLENDYQRITSRYSKIMEQLQEMLENRVRELDRDAFEICKIVKEGVFVDPLGEAFGQSVCSGPEQLTTADSVKIATVKINALETMRKIEEQVLSLRRLKKSISDILSENALGERERFAMPTIRMEGDDLSGENKQVQLFFPEDFATSDRTRAEVEQGFSELPPVRKSTQESAEVDRYFQKHISSWMVEHKDTDARVVERIRTMWENNKAKMDN